MRGLNDSLTKSIYTEIKNKKLNEELRRTPVGAELVWTSDTSTMVDALSDEEVREEYINLFCSGYEDELDNEITIEDMRYALSNDDTFYEIAKEDFEQTITPVIDEQTLEGVVFLCGTVGRWTGNHSGGAVVKIEDLTYMEEDIVNMYQLNGNLIWEGIDHDGSTEMGIYAVPKDRETQEKLVRETGVVEWELSMYDETEDEAIENAISRLYSYKDLKDLFTAEDFDKIAKVCKPIVFNNGTGMNEEVTIEPVDKQEDINTSNKSTNPFPSSSLNTSMFDDNTLIAAEHDHPEEYDLDHWVNLMDTAIKNNTNTSKTQEFKDEYNRLKAMQLDNQEGLVESVEETFEDFKNWFKETYPNQVLRADFGDESSTDYLLHTQYDYYKSGDWSNDESEVAESYGNTLEGFEQFLSDEIINRKDSSLWTVNYPYEYGDMVTYRGDKYKFNFYGNHDGTKCTLTDLDGNEISFKDTGDYVNTDDLTPDDNNLNESKPAEETCEVDIENTGGGVLTYFCKLGDKVLVGDIGEDFMEVLPNDFANIDEFLGLEDRAFNGEFGEDIHGAYDYEQKYGQAPTEEQIKEAIPKIVKCYKERGLDKLYTYDINEWVSRLMSPNRITESTKPNKKEKDIRVVMQQGDVSCIQEGNEYKVFEQEDKNEKSYKNEDEAMADLLARCGITYKQEEGLI